MFVYGHICFRCVSYHLYMKLRWIIYDRYMNHILVYIIHIWIIWGIYESYMKYAYIDRLGLYMVNFCIWSYMHHIYIWGINGSYMKYVWTYLDYIWRIYGEFSYMVLYGHIWFIFHGMSKSSGKKKFLNPINKRIT